MSDNSLLAIFATNNSETRRNVDFPLLCMKKKLRFLTDDGH